MIKKIISSGIILTALAAVLMLSAAAPLAHAAQTPQRVIAYENASVAGVSALLSSLGISEKFSIPQLGAHVLSLPQGMSVVNAVQALTNSGSFSYVEEDTPFVPTMTPNDPDYPQQWDLPKINFNKAWDTTLGTGVTVAVVDTGVNCSLPDFAGQCVSGWNVVDDNGNTNDDDGHGTGVASLIGAAINNGTQIAGAAPGAKVMPIKINQDGQDIAYTSDMAKGIVWAADHGARVANLSWASTDGGGPGYTIEAAAFYLRQKNGILFQGSGNDGLKLTWDDVSVVDTVGGIDQNNKVVFNYGKAVDFMAPATNMVCLAMTGGEFITNGTSASSPLAASVAALMLSVNPALLPWQLENLMWMSAADKGKSGRDAKYGGGIVNAKTALADAFASPGNDVVAPDSPVLTSGVGNGNTVTLDWLSGFDNVGPVPTYFIYRNGQKIGKSTGLEFVDKKPIHGQMVVYGVSSVDATGLKSAPSVGQVFLP